MQQLRRFLLGAAAAGILWAVVEVLWIELQPLVPTELLGHRRRSLPPRDLIAFAGVAIATYLPLALLVAGMVLLPLRRRLDRLSARAVFALGVFVAFAGLASLGSAVWVQLMLPGLPAASPKALALYAVAAASSVLVAAGLAAGLAKLLPSVGAGLVAVLTLSALLVGGAAVAAGRIARNPLPERGQATSDLPNILLVTIDTLRADRLGAYTDGRFDTPVADRLAREGTRFDRVVSQIPNTTPSHISIFTSVYPASHGARNGLPMRNDLKTLPAYLKEMGYFTAAFVAAYTTKSNVTGLGDSFDIYVDSMNPHVSFLSADEVEPLAVYRLLDRLQGNRVHAPVVNRRVISWADSKPPEPFFLWVHYFDPHTPYPPLPRYQELLDLNANPGYREQLEVLYPEAVRYADEQLGVLIRELEHRGLLDNAIVMVTSDHGEALGEAHPNALAEGSEPPAWRDFGHGSYLYDPVLMIPLLIWGPGHVPAGRVVRTQTESIDIATILLGLLGREPPDSFRGRSFEELLRQDAAGVHKPAISQTDGTIRLAGGRVRKQLFSVRTPEWKLVVDTDAEMEEFFDLREDPNERVNRMAVNQDIALALRKHLDDAVSFEEPTRELDELDPDSLERLQALGYLLDEETDSSSE